MKALEALLAKGEIQAARVLADRRIELFPDDFEAILVRARLCMADRDYERADALLQRAEELDAPEAPVWRAIWAEQIGHPEAVALLKEVCLSATRYEPHFVLGRILNDKNAFLEARPHLERAVALAPSYAIVHFQLAYGLMETNDITRGLEHLNHALRLNPYYSPTYLVMARLLIANGHLHDARTLLEQGLTFLPDDEGLKSELRQLPDG